ncbi:MAG TPA: alpha/beta fold hydrolase [Solirubrobacteraceae bacterium]
MRDGADPVFGLLHMPADDPGRIATAVLICPPFGWDDICSYRSRRDWAEDLTAAGYAVLRIDLPGTGDSGGSASDPARLPAWTAAVTSAASRLRLTTGCSRVAAIGISLGGLVICRAIAEGAPIDEVVLWGVPSRGHSFVRELRVFAHLEDSKFDGPNDTVGELESSPLPDGYTGAGGFVLSTQTTQALDELDVSTLTLPPDLVSRALLLERDGIAVDARLRASFEQVGATVTVADGTGYGAMMAKPHLARPPLAVFALVKSWLQQSLPSATELPEEATGSDHLDTGHPTTIELTVGDTRIHETPLTVEQPFGDLFGVLAEPVDGPSADICVVLLNAGAIRRVGPNRMWVEAARRWAALGVPTLRLDLEGIGDADGDSSRFSELAELYVPERVDQVGAALDALEARGVGSRYVLAGLCSGAHWSFHGALEDKRVPAALMLNPRTLFWNPSQQIARDFRRGLLRRSAWRRALRGEVPLAWMFALAVRAPFVVVRRELTRWYTRRSGKDELDQALDRLLGTNKSVHFIFSGNEPLYEEFKLEGRLGRMNRWPNVSLELIPKQDHTLRPIEAQRAAHQALDRALDDELRRTPAPSSSGSSVGVVD